MPQLHAVNIWKYPFKLSQETTVWFTTWFQYTMSSPQLHTTLFPTYIAHICVQLPDQVYRWLLNFPIPWSLDKRKTGNTARLPPVCSYSESSPWHTGLLKLLNLIPVGQCVTAIQQCCHQDSLLPAKGANKPWQGMLGPPLPCADLSGKSRLRKAFGIFILHFFLIKLVGSSKGIRHVWMML